MKLPRWLPWCVGLLVVIAAALWWTLGRTPPPAPLPQVTGTEPLPGLPDSPAAAPAVVADGPSADTNERTAAEPQPLDENRARARFAQGVRGTVVDERDLPLAAVAVYLIESASNDPLALPAMLQQGLLPGPTTATHSADDGSFALGLPVATERLYEVHLLAPGRADTRVTGLRLQQGQWHDLGRLVMARGAVVRGRVTVEGSELPVPQATVTLVAGTVFDDTVLRALPGRENGLVANADANGFYEFANAPLRGAVQLTAVAPGFAAVLEQNVQLQADKPVEVNFGLRPGHSLGGTLVDDGGRPIAGARIEAWPMTASGQPLLGQSHADGSFVVHGLAAGKHRVRVFARGFQNLDLPEVIPTRLDLRLQMLPRARLQVTVRDDDGQVLHSYQVAVRRYFPNKDPGLVEVSHGDLGLLADVPEQRVRLDRMTDSAEIVGIPPGDYVCQVSAEGHAKTLSAPFRIEADTRSLAVAVTMTAGATVRGRVLDESGLPLSGATVSTQAQGATPDNPLWRMLAGAAPAKVTPLIAKTGPDGSFELPMLALGSYDLVVEHAEACRTLVRNLDLHQPGARVIAPVRLASGTIVQGQATVAGKIQGQIRVILTSSSADSGPSTDPVRLEASTDENGHYTMPRRVPPGSYELRAFAVVSADPASQPIHQLLQMQRSATLLTVPPGRREVACDLDLPQDR